MIFLVQPVQTNESLVPGKCLGGGDMSIARGLKPSWKPPALRSSLFGFPHTACISTMEAKSQRPKGRPGALSALSVAIDALNVAKDISCIAPAQAAFSAVSVLLTMIRVSSLLFCRSGFPIHFYPGLHDQRTGLRRTRTELRGYL